MDLVWQEWVIGDLESIEVLMHPTAHQKSEWATEAAKNYLHNLKHLMLNHTFILIALLSYITNKEPLNFTTKRATFNL